MKRKMLNGVKLPHKDKGPISPAIRLPSVNMVYLPLLQHIGTPSVATVKQGEYVFVGQTIAEAMGNFSSPIHSSVSGTVKQIETLVRSDGGVSKVIVIESDGRMATFEDIKPKSISDYNDFINAVRDSGVVGLGGAGFPTHIKLDIKDKEKIDTIIINCAECEPFIKSDSLTMLYDTDLLFEGIELIKKFLHVKNIVIGIERNNIECIKKLSEKAKRFPYLKIKTLKPIYPQGGEKVITYNITGKVVPENKFPKDIGVLVINCTTLASISKYIKTGMPLVERTITVTGSAIEKPFNLTVPIGTPIKDIMTFCNMISKPHKILYGGPMMGIALPDTDSPVLKNTNALIFLDEKDSKGEKTTPCIRCGKCISVCPVDLNPVQISKAYKSREFSQIKASMVNVCMECGCCSYICPTRQPLVQHNKLSKAILKEGEK